MKSMILFSLVILVITSGYFFNGCKRQLTKFDLNEYNDTLIVFQGQKYHLSSSTEHMIESNWKKAPEIISSEAKQFVIDNLGEDYSTEHCKMIEAYALPNPIYSGNKRVFYYAYFNYKIKISDYYTNFLLKVSFDSLSTVVESDKIVNIKDNPSLGMPFNITHFEAVNIAIENKFSTGLSPWTVSFKYDHRDRKYYWRISNHTSKYIGSVLFIDPNTGEIVKRASWVT